MTYTEFTDIFLPALATSYRNGSMKFHGLFDFDLWKRIFPDENNRAGELQWSEVQFNAFALNDKEKSLFIVFSLPERVKPDEAKYIGFRLDSNRKRIACYSMRRPKYHDDPWQIFQYDYKRRGLTYSAEVMGTNSMREFINTIEKFDFQETPSFAERFSDVLRRF